MNYLVFALVVVIVQNWIQGVVLMTSLGKKRPVVKQVTDRKILNFIFKKSGLKIKQINIVDSDKPFGMMTGFGKYPVMILSSNLYNNFTNSEIEYAVMHEAGHFVLKHTVKEFWAAVFLILVGWILIYRGNLGFGGVIVIGVVFGLLLIQLGKKNEYQAERFAAERSSKLGMIGATKKFEKTYGDGFANLGIFYREVPYADRIKIVENVN